MQHMQIFVHFACTVRCGVAEAVRFYPRALACYLISSCQTSLENKVIKRN